MTKAAEPSPETREIPVEPPFTADGGHCWRLRLPPETQQVCDMSGASTRSPLRLTEDGVLVGPPHSVHQEIRDLGEGRYSHWDNSLYFAASDNTDPNANGRRYSLRWDAAPAEAPTATSQAPAAAKSEPTEDLAHLAAPPDSAELQRYGADLKWLFESRGVRQVVYFHTDHFEPWAGRTVEQRFQGLRAFNAITRRHPFAARQSLFYTPLISAEVRGERRPDEDIIHFSDGGAAYADEIRALAEAQRHEFHVHVHHEQWTCNDSHFDNALSKAVNAQSTPEADAERLDRFVRMSVAAVRAESGQSLDRWGFIHGNWALNASDLNICKIEHEMSLLQQHGCFGDFSFPAGRGHCDPVTITRPYTCLPVPGPKAYDTPAADPRPAGPGGRAFEAGRFFIWSSEIKAKHSSLDYYYEPNVKLFQAPRDLVQVWLEKSVLIDGVLFIKTHAHSLDRFYQAWEEGAYIPHTHPDVVRVFEVLRRACDAAAVPLETWTVNEVMDALHAMDRASAAEPFEVASAARQS